MIKICCVTRPVVTNWCLSLWEQFSRALLVERTLSVTITWLINSAEPHTTPSHRTAPAYAVFSPLNWVHVACSTRRIGEWVNHCGYLCLDLPLPLTTPTCVQFVFTRAKQPVSWARARTSHAYFRHAHSMCENVNQTDYRSCRLYWRESMIESEEREPMNIILCYCCRWLALSETRQCPPPTCQTEKRSSWDRGGGGPGEDLRKDRMLELFYVKVWWCTQLN